MKRQMLIGAMPVAALAGAAMLGTSVASAEPAVDTTFGNYEPTVEVGAGPHTAVPASPPRITGPAGPAEYDPDDYDPGEVELTCGGMVVWVYEENNLGHPIPGTFDVDCA